LAKKLGIRSENVHAEVSPEGKSMILDQLRTKGSRVAMVGDGLNDAPALASADVSIALSSGTDVAKNAADIVIIGTDLNSIADAVVLSWATLSTIRHNLFWAFSYNVVAIPLAAFGVFQSNGPLIASVAMAGSSITVVLRSAWLGKQKLRIR
jgi:P-type E1-E2 ATPase